MISLAGVPPTLWSDAWWSEFTRSAGLAGTLAVAAALIAFFSARHTTNTNNAANRAARRRDRWWEMFRWFVEQGEMLDDQRATMVIEALASEAETDFELAILAALANEMIEESDGVEEVAAP